MGGIGIVDVQQIVVVALSTTEFAVSGQFVVMETFGVAQVVLREGVGPERFVARKRKHSRCIEGVCLIRRLECVHDGVLRLQVFVCGNVLDERRIDEEKLDCGSDGKNARLVGDGALPAQHEQRDTHDYENQD